MRRLLVLCSAVGLLCGALGCHSCHSCDSCDSCHGGHGWSGHVHGRCDCEEGPLYGCHFEDYCHGDDHGYGPGPVVHAVGDVPPGMQPEPLKAMPKEIMPKDEGK